MVRGYCGIGVLNMKTEVNYGTLFRSALAFGADFVFLIGRRFQKQCSDTSRSYRHIPVFEYLNCEDFLEHIPYDCMVVGVEICERAIDLKIVSHPERAVYVLGPEDGSLPPSLIEKCHCVAKINTRICLNVAVAGSIILYDRFTKLGTNKEELREQVEWL